MTRRLAFGTVLMLTGFGLPVVGGANSSLEFDIPRVTEAARAPSNVTSLRVATWNIDRGEQLETISSELKQNAAGLVLLQEVDWNTIRGGKVNEASELARQLGFNSAYGIEFEELSQERGQPAFIGQATLTQMKIRRARILRFQHQSGFWKPHSWLPSSLPLMQRRLGSRIALITELDFCGRLLVVYNVHLESRSYGRIQADQLDEVLEDLKRYPPDAAVILGGDLNTKYFPSIFLHKLERAGYRSALGDRIQRTHAVAMALDWIFAKGPIDVSAGRVRRDFKGSDHYPIYAELKLK